MKIIGMASLYEPLQFLSNRIRNLNQCNLKDVLIYFADCSKPETWEQVKKTIESEAKFNYSLSHFDQRTTLYYTWHWIIDQTLNTQNPQYYTNVNVDDIHYPDYYQKMSTYLDQHPETHIVACPWHITKIKGQIWPPNYDNASGPTLGKTLGHFPMWRAGLHREGLNFDSRMVAIGDTYFWLGIKNKYGTKAMAIHPETLACFLSHDNNLYWVAKGPHGQSGEAYDRSIGEIPKR